MIVPFIAVFFLNAGEPVLQERGGSESVFQGLWDTKPTSSETKLDGFSQPHPALMHSRFLQEDRDNEWAAIAEARIASDIALNNVPSGSKSASVECRTSICEIVYLPPNFLDDSLKGSFKKAINSSSEFLSGNSMIIAAGKIGERTVPSYLAYIEKVAPTKPRE